MKETCKRYVEEVNELVEGFIKLTAPDFVKTAKSDEVELVQKLLKLVGTSNEMIIKQAFLIEDMNAKLDTLLVNHREES